MPAELLFASYAPKTLEPKCSVGAKWIRLLERLDLAATVKNKRTAIKLHLGGKQGFSTIHPYLVRKLVEQVKAAGAKNVFVTDGAGAVNQAAERGYTSEVLGCPLVAVSGTADRYFYKRELNPPAGRLTEVELAGEIVDAEALIDFSHVKGHGDCGFGGASKNLSMGCVTSRTRGALHALEGGLDWKEAKCSHCGACIENCPNEALSWDKDHKFKVFYHDCKLCQHCVLICPEKALTISGQHYLEFQQGMARTTAAVLDTFAPENVLFINALLDIIIFCDCWGMTTPALVPDIGILAGRDIVAIEQASLDLIRTENLIPGTVPPGYELGKHGHLFERLHRKDPYAVVAALSALERGNREYHITEVE